MNSFLKWAGSKRKLLPKLLESVPTTFDRYVEPFAGSACLFFQLQPTRAILADINEDLIRTYRQLREHVEDVVVALTRLNCSESEYYEVRSADPSKMPGPARAARFIYLNRFCFNGLYRTNRKGLFNVPFGGKRGGQLPAADTLRDCAFALKKVSLRTTSFEQTLETVKPGDFVYLDPPYSIQSRRVFNQYSNATFGATQLANLRRHLKRMDRHGIPFLVSYGQSQEATDLAEGFHFRQLVVQRQIAGFAADRRKSRELIITNF